MLDLKTNNVLDDVILSSCESAILYPSLSLHWNVKGLTRVSTQQHRLWLNFLWTGSLPGLYDTAFRRNTGFQLLYKVQYIHVQYRNLQDLSTLSGPSPSGQAGQFFLSNRVSCLSSWVMKHPIMFSHLVINGSDQKPNERPKNPQHTGYSVRKRWTATGLKSMLLMRHESPFSRSAALFLPGSHPLTH